MTWKCAVVNIPLAAPRAALHATEAYVPGELERMTRRYTSAILPLIGPERTFLRRTSTPIHRQWRGYGHLQHDQGLSDSGVVTENRSAWVGRWDATRQQDAECSIPFRARVSIWDGVERRHGCSTGLWQCRLDTAQLLHALTKVIAGAIQPAASTTRTA